jgi:hypothetical protein
MATGRERTDTAEEMDSPHGHDMSHKLHCQRTNSGTAPPAVHSPRNGIRA